MDKTERYDSLFRYYGEKHGIHWELLKAQAIAESNLDPEAKSPVGARGLAQFMPATWQEWGHDRDMGCDDRTDPECAIEAQARYMVWISKRPYIRTNAQLLAAYNWGVGNLRKSPGRETWPKETKVYVDKVLQFAGMWEEHT